jgi:hypothetical protein
MKQELILDTIAAIMLYVLLMAWIGVSSRFPSTVNWAVLYFAVLIALAIPFAIVVHRPLIALVEKLQK